MGKRGRSERGPGPGVGGTVFEPRGPRAHRTAASPAAVVGALPLLALISGDEDPADPVSLVLTLASVAADTSRVEDHKNVEGWADALLEQHRTTPGAGRGGRPADHNALDRVPFTMRLAIKLSAKLSGEPPDPEVVARMQPRRERFPVLQRVDTVLTWIAIAVFCVLVYAAFKGPSFF